MKVVPNILSVFRICLVPVFVIIYFTDDNEVKYYAAIIFIVAGLSDILDGYIARKFQAHSRLGKILDPLGDKLMTFTALICITISNHVFFWAVLVFFVKEVLMGIGGLVLHKIARIEMPPAKFIGKASTLVFFVVCAALMLFGNIMPDLIAIILTYSAICLSIIAFFVYLGSYIKIMRERPRNNAGITEINGETECNRQSAQDVNETLP